MASTPRRRRKGGQFGEVDIDVPFKIAKQRLVDEFDRKCLEAHDSNTISPAARAAGIERMSIYKMIRRLGLDKQDEGAGRARRRPTTTTATPATAAEPGSRREPARWIGRARFSNPLEGGPRRRANWLEFLPPVRAGPYRGSGTAPGKRVRGPRYDVAWPRVT
jgi:hypothetical protein